jgi:acyl carrier protein
MSSLPKIQQMLAEEFDLPLDQLTPDAALEARNIDSLSALEFMFVIEDEFGIKMPGELASIKTVGDIARTVDELLAAKGAAPA